MVDGYAIALASLLTARVGPKLPMAARAHAGSGYRTLLPALLLWGIGLGVTALGRSELALKLGWRGSGA